MNVIFNTKRRRYDPHRDTLSCTSDCPVCDQEVHFWIVDTVAHLRPEDDDDPNIFMLPSTSNSNLDFNKYDGKVPESVLRYCMSAQDVYFSGNLTATNVLLQAAIESVFADFLPTGNSKTTLTKMIRDSMDNLSLNEPITNIANDLNPGGNMDVLFQHHEGTSQEAADAMMTLLENLITYLYVMPEEFNELHERFAKINDTSKLTRRGDEDADEVLRQAS
jgi:hypothetical protein